MKIGIIGAMPVEIEELKNQLEGVQKTTHHGFDFYEGKIEHHDVIVLLSGVGKVSAAVGTILMIEKYNPEFIINTGTAGGLATTKVYDLILAKEVRHHDVDLTAFGYEKGQCSRMPVAFSTDEVLTQKAFQLINKNGQAVHQGTVVSGDSFINDPVRLAQIEKDFPEALAVEMEAAAIAQVCHMLQVPFIMLRAISDKAGEGNTVSFETFVKESGKLSAKINMEFIRQLDKA